MISIKYHQLLHTQCLQKEPGHSRRTLYWGQLTRRHADHPGSQAGSSTRNGRLRHRIVINGNKSLERLVNFEAERTVSSVAESRHDVALFVEIGVNGCRVDFD